MEQILIGKNAKPKKEGSVRKASDIKRKGRNKPDAVIYNEKLAKTVKEIEKKTKVRLYLNKAGERYRVVTYGYFWKYQLKDPIIKLRMTPPFLKNIENK